LGFIHDIFWWAYLSENNEWKIDETERHKDNIEMDFRDTG